MYVAPFPGPGGTRQISTAGGSEPRWRRDDKELFSLDPDERLTAADVNGQDPGFEVGVARPLFVVRRGATGNAYDVSPDGQRFLVNVMEEQTNSSPIAVVVNWAAGLKK